MKITLFISFLFLCSILVAQREADNIVYGICTEGDPCDSPFSTGVVKFDDDSIVSINNLPINGSFQRGGSTSISDTSGNLLLAFNGKYLYKADGAIVDTFFYGMYDTMTVAPGHGLILKLNRNDSDYYLFNSYGKFIQNHPILASYESELFLTRIHINNTVIIEEKMSVILNDSTSGGQIVSCRHANGRDWWVLKSGLYKNKFYIGLLNPNGIEMNEVFTEVANEYQSSVAFNFFSSDGTKFFHFAGFNDRILWEYNFDRCTGELSNPIEHDFSGLLDPFDVPPMCLSPDGKIVYIRRSNPVTFQAELIQYQLESHLFHLIDVNTFGPILTPNNKWVLNCRNIMDTTFQTWGTNWLDIIYSPNNIGEQANYLSLAYEIPNLGLGTRLPNYANYRLGPIDGSNCDTLGIDNTESIASLSSNTNRINLYPNPVEHSFILEHHFPGTCEISLSNMLGQIVWQGQINEQKVSFKEQVQNLNSGIYWVAVQELKSGKYNRIKFVKR